MRNKSIAIFCGVFLACGLGSFAVTYALQSQPVAPVGSQPSSRPADIIGGWLALLPEQVEQVAGVDPGYAAERAALEAALQGARERLAALFEDPEASDAAIAQQIEEVVKAHGDLERRVARYLLAIRPHLTDEQRSKLFTRCATGVREARGWRWRHERGGRQMGDTEDEPGRRPGRGPGSRGGRGRGGPRWERESKGD